MLPCGPVERFVHFLPMMQHTGLELATILLMFLDLHGLDIKKCRGQSYDNASLNTAVGLLKSLIEFVQQKRDKFDHFECCGVECVGHENIRLKRTVCVGGMFDGALKLVRKHYCSLENALR